MNGKSYLQFLLPKGPKKHLYDQLPNEEGKHKPHVSKDLANKNEKTIITAKDKKSISPSNILWQSQGTLQLDRIGF